MRDWLAEFSFVEMWPQPTDEIKKDVWLDGSNWDFGVPREDEGGAWVARPPSTRPMNDNGKMVHVRDEFVLLANHDCNFVICNCFSNKKRNAPQIHQVSPSYIKFH